MGGQRRQTPPTPFLPQKWALPVSSCILVFGQAFEGRFSILKCQGGNKYLQNKVKFKEGKEELLKEWAEGRGGEVNELR